ncbi:MAG: DNA starvation/stationary phase protection protein [Gammaproteobacteria bacterium]|nr:DNA starvation/stationary phase protection protein [Gammaproteobacteria bacterium]
MQQSLQQVFSDTYALYLKTQNYHWNVTGLHFKSLHDMFEEQYDSLAEAIDELAERIRALGEKTKASFTYFRDMTKITEPDQQADAEAMLHDLLNSHEQLISSLEQAKKISGDQDDSVTEDMMIARLSAHQKVVWMLRASLSR